MGVTGRPGKEKEWIMAFLRGLPTSERGYKKGRIPAAED